MVNTTFSKALQFLSEHREVAFATSEGILPELRMFQTIFNHFDLMEGTVRNGFVSERFKS